MQYDSTSVAAAPTTVLAPIVEEDPCAAASNAVGWAEGNGHLVRFVSPVAALAVAPAPEPLVDLQGLGLDFNVLVAANTQAAQAYRTKKTILIELHSAWLAGLETMGINGNSSNAILELETTPDLNALGGAYRLALREVAASLTRYKDTQKALSDALQRARDAAPTPREAQATAQETA
jgi:hypothetical protein